MTDDYSTAASRSPADFAVRRRVVVLMAYLGYAACYLVRNNVAVASDLLSTQLGWTAVQIGSILTGFTISYGIGKLLMGIAVDQFRLRYAFGWGLAISAALCVLLTTMSTPTSFTVVLVLIGLAQGACAPAALATLGAWFPPATRGAQVAVWNTSQNVGAALLPMLVSGGLALSGPDDWRVAFWLPGIVALGFSAVFFRYGGDRPWQEGMPTLKELYGANALPQVTVPPEIGYWRLVRVHIIGNRVLAMLALLNALLYLLRFGVLNWIPIYQIQQRDLTQEQAGWVISVFEWGAIPGALLYGWVALRHPHRTARSAAIGIAVLAVAILLYADAQRPSYILVLAAILGALIYGPQVIVNILTLNLVSPRAIGIAVGWVGLGGYLVGAVTANLTLPRVASASSWYVSLILLALTCLVCVWICMWLGRAERRAVGGSSA